MSSPARRYIEMRQAMSLSRRIEDGDDCRAYKKLLLQLKQDKQILKAIDSIQDKQIAKREMLTRYQAWIVGVMAGTAEPVINDEIFVTVLLWHIDAGQLNEAVPLALFAIEHQMQSGDEFKRSLPCIVFEQISEQLGVKDNAIEPDCLEQLIIKALLKNEDGRHGIDMPDQVRAKFFKAAGLVYLEKQSNQIRAKALFEMADAYDPRVGVKKMLKELANY